jgi:hypothetical protein
VGVRSASAAGRQPLLSTGGPVIDVRSQTPQCRYRIVTRIPARIRRASNCSAKRPLGDGQRSNRVEEIVLRCEQVASDGERGRAPSFAAWTASCWPLATGQHRYAGSRRDVPASRRRRPLLVVLPVCRTQETYPARELGVRRHSARLGNVSSSDQATFVRQPRFAIAAAVA